MTEDEAKTKWCPLVRLVGFKDSIAEGTSWNRAPDDPDGQQSPGTKCIASACMAWRYDEAEYEHGECLPLGAAPADPGWEQDGETWYCGPGVSGEKRMRWKRAKPRTGYCNAFERVRSW